MKTMILLSLGIIIGILLSLFIFIIEAKAAPHVIEKIERKVAETQKAVIFDKPHMFNEFEINDEKGIDTVL